MVNTWMRNDEHIENDTWIRNDEHIETDGKHMDKTYWTHKDWWWKNGWKWINTLKMDDETVKEIMVKMDRNGLVHRKTNISKLDLEFIGKYPNVGTIAHLVRWFTVFWRWWRSRSIPYMPIVYVYLFLHIYLYIYICICIYIYIEMQRCIDVCMCIYIYILNYHKGLLQTSSWSVIVAGSSTLAKPWWSQHTSLVVFFTQKKTAATRYWPIAGK